MRLLGSPLTAPERLQAASAARGLMGTPWKHKGRSTRAVDCIGFLWLVFKAVRPIPKPRDDYGRTAANRKLRGELIAYLGEPIQEDPQVGDVVTMRWTGEEHHVGLLVPHPFYGLGLIHADNSAAGGPRVVEHGIDEAWAKRVIEIFRP